MIGDPETRYREDPVRIIRVVRFAAKLGFGLEAATERPVRSMAPLLANVPISRLFDEMVKLLQTGHALASVEQLRKYGLIGGTLGVFPVLDAALAPSQPNPARETFVRLALEDTDRRVNEGRAVVPSFMLACMLWHDVQERWTALRAEGESPFPALQLAVDAVFDARIGDISGRGRLAADMREIWLMQPRFERRTPSSAKALIDQQRFRAGYDFLRLRADSGELAPELADWWEDYHLGEDDERDALLEDVRPASATRVRHVPRAQVQGDMSATAPAGPATVVEGDAAAPRKRRRRRRRPGGGGAEGAPPAE
jgi:poly(A) polymerase